MSTRLPVTPVIMPAALQGHTSPTGKLPANLLFAIGDKNRYGDYPKLFLNTVIAWDAMVHAIQAEVHISPTWTSWPDTYRDYAMQESGFRRRMTWDWTLEANGLKNRYANKRRWPTGSKVPGGPVEDHVWYLRKNTAGIAVPGTSNHGLGLAIDMSSVPRDQYQFMVQWLIAHAIDFGFSAETQSEDWHWRFVAGDTFPQRVLDYWKVIRGEFKQGDRDERIKRAQDIMRDIAKLPVGNSDGAFGPKTRSGVDSIQAQFSLPRTGMIDKATWVALDHLDYLN